MRILSIDFGRKRTGLAVTDPLQIIAGGLATVATSSLFDYLKDYISKEEVKYYTSIISFCKGKHISPESISKKEKANEYIPKLKGFVVFIHPRYKKNK